MGIVNQAAKWGSSPPAVGIRAAAPLVAGVVLLDWITKWAITVSMDHGALEAVLPGFFNLVHVRNTGIAFSLFADSAPWIRNLVLPAVSVAAIIIVFAMMRDSARMPVTSRTALALVLAGAVGNLSERLLHGYVTDFLDFYAGPYHWPAFNVADSAITIGAVLLILDSLLGRHAVQEAARVA